MTLLDGTKVGPADRLDWLAARRSGIGASEAAAVLGYCPYTTPRELYARKLGLTPEVEETEAMRRGQHMEKFLAAEYRRRYPGVSMAEQVFLRHPEHRFLFATLDGLRDDGVIVEFKTAGHRQAAKWGTDGSDEVPESYLCQVHHQMAVSGRAVAHVFASIGGDDCRLFVVRRNETLIDHLIEAATEFWRSVEMRDPPPVARAGDGGLDHLIHPEPEGAFNLGREGKELVDRWQDAVRARAIAEQTAELLRAEVLEAMGDFGLGMLPDGRTVTKKVVTRKGGTYERKDAKFTDLRVKEARRKRDGN